MCLGIPAKVLSITETDPINRSAIVDFNGAKREVNLSFVEDAKVGDYVIVHVGFAISKINEEEAKEVFEYLEELGEVSK